jgi:hypothetical protein
MRIQDHHRSTASDQRAAHHHRHGCGTDNQNQTAIIEAPALVFSLGSINDRQLTTSRHQHVP